MPEADLRFKTNYLENQRKTNASLILLAQPLHPAGYIDIQKKNWFLSFPKHWKDIKVKKGRLFAMIRNKFDHPFLEVHLS